ncbi:TraB/GumN family protein [Altererythrobacter sp. RZ02]|uniref:TraB/GumN family protein n=1 Tax=Pontixanthobacter rizhaonensis TaxID=2730337 RepID=A0A848QKU4_9SPHN|nr:TraB/GumN family protein [Pontixanthobacter rizhaonensis]NMW31360.1 TraB/GumN family protein [Pontixanthobacter rizhaonensis]
MISKYFFGPLAALVLLSGCGSVLSDNNEAGTADKPSPALWLVADDAGNTEGWLFGTIHALPDGVRWRTEALDRALQQSEALAVEIANLDDQQALARTFYQLALSPRQLALVERVSSDRVKKLERMMAKGDFDQGHFQSTDTWAAAITLAQLQSVGDSENGVDRALIRSSGNRLLIELEGTARQLGIFDQLPAKEQIDLLHAVIDETQETDAGKPSDLVATWIKGDMQALEQESMKGMLADPELRSALLVQRNQDWVRQLQVLFPDTGPIMVAVGAAHMAGSDGLPDMLRQQGYTVTRIQ